jgi:hypothetical protein
LAEAQKPLVKGLMMGRFVRGVLLGLLMVVAVGVWPAAADVSSVSVTSPSTTIKGYYDTDGTAKAFSDQLGGTASTGCKSGWASIYFIVTGPGSYNQKFSVSSPPQSSGTWNGHASSAWDTTGLLNGVYSVRLYATDKPHSSLFDGCDGATGSASRSVKVADAPSTPAWASDPTTGSGGQSPVSLSWKKNPESDVVNYHIVRTGPNGTTTAIAPPSVCGTTTCSATDSFDGEYSGTYTYQIVAYRSAPSGTGEECAPGSTDQCVKSSGSDIKSVSLTKPTPSPTPSDSPTSGPPSSDRGSGGSGGTGSHSKSKSNTRVLSFGGGGSSSYNDFYTGTYKENLPYQPKTFILGNGQTTAPSDRQIEAASVSDAAPNYRTIMLPVAGGLLAFLSAAHVRRLLIHF